MKIRPVGTKLFHGNGRTDGQTWRIQYAPSQYCESAHKYKLSVYISDAITRFCWTNVV